MAKVLVVEDDTAIAQVVRDSLSAENYVIDVAGTVQDARHFLQISSYDAIVLDWELPDGAGIEICRDLRQAGEPIPILMLTARATTGDRVQGLDSGADDYLTKPFECSELVARVRSLLRRLWHKKAESLSYGILEMDIQTRRVFVEGNEVKLLKKEFELLELLLRHPTERFSTEGLLERLWGDDRETGSDAVFQCIRRLRRKLDKPDSPSLIVLDHGYGYRLQAPVAIGDEP